MECNTETIKIGLSFFEAEDLIEDVWENDTKLHYCITPKTIYKF
jgi:5-formyltetrahydrofolate cyclo-ligase